MNAKQLKGKTDPVLKILDEIKPEPTAYGIKPTGTVEYKDGLATIEKTMRFNQSMINWLIKKSEATDSKKWIGMEVPVKIENIKGNDAIVPKEKDN